MMTTYDLGNHKLTKGTDIIVSDLVPLRYRGNYIGVILSIYGVGTTLGPFIGGSIVATTTWRWIFYLNLPIGGASFLVLFLFLQVNYQNHMTFAQKVRRIDFVGNAVLVASTVSVLYALAYAGTSYSWGSWHILVPLLVGFLGLVLFGFTQASSRFAAAEPVIPPRLFKHRTSVIVSINTFINSALTFWGVFFLVCTANVRKWVTISTNRVDSPYFSKLSCSSVPSMQVWRSCPCPWWPSRVPPSQPYP